MSALTKREKVHMVIHSASASAAGVGGGLAQAPGSDATLIVPIQIAMIVSIAKIHGHHISEARAASLLGSFSATVAGRFISQVLVGWIPGVGNIINAATAATITEAIGWAADKYFENLGEELE